MGRVTIIFYPNDRKQSKTTEQIPIYLRVRKARIKSEARTDWSISPHERALWNKNMQRINLKNCAANDYLNKIEEKFNALRIFKSSIIKFLEQGDDIGDEMWEFQIQSKPILNELNEIIELKSPGKSKFKTKVNSAGKALLHVDSYNFLKTKFGM